MATEREPAPIPFSRALTTLSNSRSSESVQKKIDDPLSRRDERPCKVSMSEIVEKLRLSTGPKGIRRRTRRLMSFHREFTGTMTKRSQSFHNELKACVFEIVLKTYDGDPNCYWHYAEYPEFGLSPNSYQSQALKSIINHLNHGTPQRTLHFMRCKNAFVSGDHQKYVMMRTQRPRRRKKGSDHWLELRS